jgi:hypothetical protein
MPATSPRAPSVYFLPLELQRLLHIRDRHSRAEWKRLPFDAMPPHAGPLLVFDEFGEPVTWVDDWSGRTLHSGIELADLIADQLQYQRSADGERRAKLAKRIRRRWCALVDHAIGYTVAGSLDILEFADD